jgi:tetratricopeptide (TPR) repeat protein
MFSGFVVCVGLAAMALQARPRLVWAADAAAPPPAPPPSGATKAEARERFDRGVSLFEKGENASALAEFKRAFELIPNPLLLYNMGLVYAAMNRPIESTDALQAFLLAPGTQSLGEQRKKAERVHSEQATRIAQLVVLTDTPATIEIDGIEAGHTPLSKPLRVPSGAHVVSAAAPGFLPTRKELTLAGQVTETVTLSLSPTEAHLGQLVVRASLPGAEVLVNGKRVGVTPLPASVAVVPGAVTVEVRRDGYRPVTQSVSLDDGARGELAFRLEEDPAAPATVKGRLVLAINEPGADVAVDGQPRALGDGAIPLVAGGHTVRVQRGGFEPFEQTVDVAAQRDTSLTVVLLPTPETRAQLSDSVRLRRTVGVSLAAAGAAVAVAAGVYAVLVMKDVSSSQDQLNLVKLHEGMAGDPCYLMSTQYMAHGCDVIHATAQDQVDTNTLHRNLGFAGAGVGLVAAGVGAYLLVTTPSGAASERSVAHRSLSGTAWADGRNSGVLLMGRF